MTEPYPRPHHPPYHRGQRRVQRLAGSGEQARRLAGIMEPSLGNGARMFLSTVGLVVLAALDTAGRCWVTHRAGAAGFVHTDEATIHLAAPARPPLRREPLATQPPGAMVGGVAIDMARRRRLRFSGRVRHWDADAVTVDVERAFGNCPRYIDPAARFAERLPAARACRSSSRLSAAQRAIIGSAGFFFVGSGHPHHGVDASHRGGPPGFVTVHGPAELSFPDYPGNGMFATLGNIAECPEAGLLFADDSGTTLQLTGRAAIRWDRPDGEQAPTGRRIEFALVRVVETRSSATGAAGPGRAPTGPARPAGSPAPRSPGSAPSPGRRRAGPAS